MDAIFQERYRVILENEKALTSYVAGEAIDKPQPAMWMILIPIFFVFFYFQFKRYKEGLKSFKFDFMKTRKRVLDAVHQALVYDTPVNVEELVALGNAPKEAREAYGAWIEELATFYRSLLQAEGRDYPSLLKSCYKKQSNCLIALNKLTTVERGLNKALVPDLDTQDERTLMAIASIERSCEDFRRNQANEVFSR